MALRYGIGLRVQIISAVLVASALVLVLLGVAWSAFYRQDAQHQAQQRARDIANTLAQHWTVRDFVEATDRRAGICEQLGVAGVGVQSNLVKLAKVCGSLAEGVVESASGVGGWQVTVAVTPEQRASFFSPWMLYGLLTFASVGILLYLFLTRAIVAPLQRVTSGAEEIAGGNLRTRVDVQGSAEVLRLARSFNRMTEQLAADRQELERTIAELQTTSQDLATAEDHALRQAQLAAVGRLSAGIAHEIGNPLAAIRGLAELAKDQGISDDKRREFAERIYAEAERIHHTLRELLDFARDQKSRKEDTLVDIRAPIRGAIELVRPRQEFRALQIREQLSPAPATVRGSEQRLTQLFVNLIVNAADACKGEGEVTISLEHNANASAWVARVSDSGPGFDPSMLPHAFEPFVTSKDAGKGTGLGLWICHAIVEQNRGTIRAFNRGGAGACVEVSLPIAT